MPTEAQFSPPADDPLRNATPAVDDVEARRARAAIEGRLFSGPAKRVKVGRYRVLGRIGSGGMGVVYKANDPDLARDVAVKLMNHDAVSDTDTDRARGRLVREARAMARLAHPNVIHVYDVGTVEDGVFIAMELVDGESLGAWLTAQPRSWQQTLGKYLDAGHGLAAAHEAGVIHRDFKPENVLVGSDGRVRVGDFGLAGGAGSETGRHETPLHESGEAIGAAAVNETLTRTGALLGTPKYMAPEQESGLPATARSDQFSFCVALFEALFGDAPFEGDSVLAYRHNVREGNVRSCSVPDGLPPWVVDVLRRGLHPDPVLRYPDMNSLLERLGEALTEPAAVPPRRRKRAGWWVGAGLVALAVGVGFQLGQPVTPMEVVVEPAAVPPTPDDDALRGANAEALADPPVTDTRPQQPPPDGPAAPPEPLPAGAVEETAEPQPETALRKATPTPLRSRKRSGTACYFRAGRRTFIAARKGTPQHLKKAGSCFHPCHKMSPAEAAKATAPQGVTCRAKFACEDDVDGAACKS